MEAFLVSTATVAIAEIGDKTQLLSLLLVAKFRNRTGIILGILTATLLNHGVSAWFGVWLSSFLENGWASWIIGGSFIAVGLWLLIPEQEEKPDSRFDKYGVFLVTTLLFFLAEIGDKTQIATVILGAQYQSISMVTIGTTLGMLAANVPVICWGPRLLKKVPLHITRWIGAALFVILGLSAILWG
ncbi:MAG: putative membrane protein [Idiomarinaceae bacterium HL-53]|nr:MAG: putative membrane protein [Idiomarinaceae bacterium HL-53]CUS48055.1 Putative Ca2+/H+ antiporter, TMEM165/GDT1 family [Idiomarinaceae bacterium HL-53]